VGHLVNVLTVHVARGSSLKTNLVMCRLHDLVTGS